MFSIVKVHVHLAGDQTQPGSLLTRPRGWQDERPWERGWIPLSILHHLVACFPSRQKMHLIYPHSCSCRLRTAKSVCLYM